MKRCLLIAILFLSMFIVTANPYSSNINQDYSSSTEVNVNTYVGNLTNLSQMADVNTPAPSDGEFLVWDNSIGAWIASALSSFSKWIVDSSNGYLSNDSDTIYFDDALLNTTIDTRAVTTEADPIYDAENNTIARIGDCPAGQVVMNITTGGVECVASDDGDITSVQGDNVYIYNGSDSGDVVLMFNDTLLNLNITNANTSLYDWVVAQSYLTAFTELDPEAYNGTLAYLADIISYSYYNSTDFVITDYSTTTDMNTAIEAGNTTLLNWIIAQAYATNAITWANAINGTLYLSSNPDGYIIWSQAINEL